MQEIYVCYRSFYQKSRRDLAGLIYLNNNRKFCFYDYATDLFYDSNLKPIDIRNKIIIPRGNDINDKFLNRIIECGGIIPCGLENYQTVLNWPLFYQTKRKLEIVEGKDLINPNFLDNIEKKYGSRFFFKTVEKQFSDIVNIDDFRKEESLIHVVLSLHPTDKFIISEVVDIINDNIGNKEYRVFVFDNQILSISRFTEFILHSIDPMVYEKALEIVESLRNLDFPTAYSFDLFEYKDVNNNTVIDVVEFNDYIMSGYYLYNAIDYIPQIDILHQNKNLIAPEFKNLIGFCRLPDEKYKNILKGKNGWSRVGSFSYDLSLIGEYKTGIFNGEHDFYEQVDLGKNVGDYLKNKNSESACFSDSNINTKKMLLDAERYSMERLKNDFLNAISLEECPVDVDYLFTHSIPENLFDDPKCSDSGFIKVNSKILEKLKEKL